MSRARRIVAAAGTALAVTLVFAAAPARAATTPGPTTATAKTAATNKTATTASKTAAAKAAAAKVSAAKAAAANAKTVAAAKARVSTAINVDGIRSAAIAALASRGTVGEPAARARLAAAVAVAAHTATASALQQAWAHTTPTRLVAVYTALAQVGTPYQSLGMAPTGFDCSGLVWYAWHAAGVSLPRSSYAQHAGLRSAADLAHALPGDIIWYPGHVELYLGAGRAMVHAKQRGDVVQVEDDRKATVVKIATG
jgi:cell wall-associated NlpC family hydrolase